MKIASMKIMQLMLCLLLFSCQPANEKSDVPSHLTWFSPKEKGMQNGGVKLVKIKTINGEFNVWTKTIGNNPKARVLLVNGGPGLTHEYFECFESFFPAQGIEFIYYDQLDCGNSDHPGDTSLYEVSRYVEEIEQVRKALQLDESNFFLLGHSWGGILAMEYALKYQQHLKGLIISNMMCDAAAYDAYADNVLSKTIPEEVLNTIRNMEERNDYSNPAYMELLLTHYYTQHILRLAVNEWPEPVNRSFSKLNNTLYITMQGPSEFGIAGKLQNWSVKDRMKEITVPVLSIGAKYDTMDPLHMEWISKEVKNGTFLLCGNGSHMCFYDDQQQYFSGLSAWISKIAR